MQAPNPKLQQAIQHHQNGQLNEAITLYKELIQEGGAVASVYSNLSGALSQQGKPKEAIELLNSAISSFPNDIGMALSLGQTYLSVGDLNNARQLANSILLKFPTQGEAHFILGNIFLNENNIDQAILSFEKTIEALPQFVEAHFSLGMAFSQKGETEEAEKKWKHSIALMPNFIPAWINLANMAIDASDYENALSYLDQVISFDPDHFSAIKMKGMTLHTTGEINQALELYQKLHQEQNPSGEIITLIANAYRDLDQFEEAEKYYQEALKINPNNQIAKENIEVINGRKVAAWHFNMLDDLKRNEGYDESIQRNIKKGDTVLDIGTGSGLLSMMCARAGAQKIYTCEVIKPIADVAKDIIADNNYQDQIEVFQTKSTNLKLGDDIPRKVDVLISEILDAGLLGEGVIPTIRHAKANLLKEDGIIIPSSAGIKTILVQSPQLKKKEKIKNVSGFDLSRFGKFQIDINYRPVVLSQVSYVELSNEFVPLSVDFYNLPKVATAQNPNIHTMDVEIQTDGEIDAVAFWFDLNFDEQLTLSSGPEGEMIHWGQTVCRLPEPLKVKKGEIITVKAEQSELKISFSCVKSS